MLKVGMRVRKVRLASAEVRPFDIESVPLGATGTIVGVDERGWYEWTVDYDGITPESQWPHCFAFSYMLAPLTDPKAERFVENLKRLVREPLPVHPSQLEEA